MSNFILIKGDVSGIQDFIFNVQSKNAAKTLKSRSYFIEAIGYLAERYLQEKLGSRLQSIYNGGGNFYCKIEKEAFDPELFKIVKNKLITAFPHFNLAISLAYKEWENDKNYGEALADLNHEANRAKLSRYSGINEEEAKALFDPWQDDGKERNERDGFGKWQKLFKAFTDKLKLSTTYIISGPNDIDDFIIDGDSGIISAFGFTLKLGKGEGNQKEENKIQKHIPLWNEGLREKYKELIIEKYKHDGDEANVPQNNGIIEFDYLARFAKERTGTDNLGILKMDVDNLGKLFQSLPDEETNKKVSIKIKDYFSKRLDELLDMEFNPYSHVCQLAETRVGYVKKDKGYLLNIRDYSEKYKYSDNLYVVFAGGDDCFIIGAWDSVIEFTRLLRKDFDNFQKKLRSSINVNLPVITLSAAIVLVDAHYPVIKFAQMAEDHLHNAKNWNKGEKNRVSFLGKIFTWDTFDRIAEVKDQFTEMVVMHKAPKAVLQRIINSFERDILFPNPQLPFDPALLWRFLYHFRDIRHKDYFKDYFHGYFFGDDKGGYMGGVYKEYLYDAFQEKSKLPYVLPMAARWAEFLSRKKD